ncbi:hypothetical protein D9M68_100210 [compost metagenome]
MKPVLSVLAATLLLGACTTVDYKRNDYRSYAIGRESTAPTGGVMFTDQHGYIIKERTWVGLINSPDGWKTTQTMSDDYYKKELIYSGISGATIELNYREFRQGFAAQAFYQSVKYDLAQSKTVQFQNFMLEVISADNNQIKYRVVRD